MTRLGAGMRLLVIVLLVDAMDVIHEAGLSFLAWLVISVLCGQLGGAIGQPAPPAAPTSGDPAWPWPSCWECDHSSSLHTSRAHPAGGGCIADGCGCALSAERISAGLFGERG